MAQQAQLVGPLAGLHLLARYTAQIALHVDAHVALRGQILHHLGGEVVGQQRAQVEHTGLDGLQLADGEGGRLGEHPLCAVVHVLAVAVLEEHVRGRVEGHHVDARLAQLLHLAGEGAADGGNELESDITRQGLQGPGHIIGRAAGTVGVVTRCNDVVAGDVTYTADVFLLHVVSISSFLSFSAAKVQN